jgi:hypothetical protein
MNGEIVDFSTILFALKVILFQRDIECSLVAIGSSSDGAGRNAMAEIFKNPPLK